MLLTIETTHKPATDLGFLLHKNPGRNQSFELAFGKVHIIFPEATETKCTMAMLLDVDPIEMVRGKRMRKTGIFLEEYINDRPYVASSFVSVAIAQVLGTALNGQCKQRPELVDTEFPLVVNISALPCHGGEDIVKRLFEPLGYDVDANGYLLDDKFTEWGNSIYYSVVLKKNTTLKELLSHLYVLIPVLDNQKHYYIGKDEIDKLIKKGSGWLAQHPDKELVARRYLKYRMSLAREALGRLEEENIPLIENIDENDTASTEEEIEKTISLNEERLNKVLEALKKSGANKVMDLGCGEGHLLSLLLKNKQFENILGMDVSIRSLERASQKLNLDKLPLAKRKRIELIHGSLMYKDSRFDGYDAAAIIEVIEHLDTPRLAAFERVVFEFAKPPTVVVTTPNREYNVTWENLGKDKLRHGDHRFEWTREEFQKWCNTIAGKFNYNVEFHSIGEELDDIGSPTQMGVFSITE